MHAFRHLGRDGGYSLLTVFDSAAWYEENMQYVISVLNVLVVI